MGVQTRYQNFTDSFIKESAESNAPFFLYMPFSHVHTTAANQPEKQYAGCDWQNSTTRGELLFFLKDTRQFNVCHGNSSTLRVYLQGHLGTRSPRSTGKLENWFVQAHVQ